MDKDQTVGEEPVVAAREEEAGGRIANPVVTTGQLVFLIVMVLNGLGTEQNDWRSGGGHIFLTQLNFSSERF